MLSALMLDTGMVKHERRIPNFAQVREWMRSGRSGVTNAVCEWEPEELDEVFYWEAVMELEKMGFRM